jgi:hypothetical protein
MNVDFAFICDYADVTNKINALGIGFDTIFAPKIPFKHTTFFVVVQLRTNLVEAGDKNLEVFLIDEDGKEIVTPIRSKFNIPKPQSGTESIGRLAIRFDNTEFPKYGSYSLHVLVEGHEMVRIPLKISQPPSA